MEDEYIMCPPAPVVHDLETGAVSDDEEEEEESQASLICQSLLPPCHCLRRWLVGVLAR